ncbi:hypothetical protein LCI18_001435 [Fusarium solani-melongenae]|uniref:Uncharacterized protein n=1 Tax=Fusarium solani subsp. cucurbitae TaxID=2747967 RepID=A0ACD3YNJ1_FUSSC|nr:hypothetical protein LCI18_001435 [Fusarium solani-melongenae]
MVPDEAVMEPFGNPAPFAEPAWYNCLASPYYKESHRRVREYVRNYLDEHIAPYAEEWEEQGHVPDDTKRGYAQAGLAFQEMPAEYSGGVQLPGGVPADEWDIFHLVVLNYEVGKLGYAGVTAGLSGGTSIGLPPIIHHGTEEQKRRWLPGIFSGETSFCLGATEPTGEMPVGVLMGKIELIVLGGSDLANLKTTAKKTDDGRAYVVNGHKKWITGAIRATHMTTAVRTGGPGIEGVSVLVIPLNSPGVTLRKINNSGWNSAESTWVTLENVVVSADHLIGQENAGFRYLMTNFNRERLMMAVMMNGQARACLEDAWAYAIDRQTFGKPLFSHQIIRHKLATLARYIESHWAWIEQIAYHANVTNTIGTDLASRIALAKVHGGRLLELANREAQQIFGGAGYQRNGVGARVEQISRDLRVITDLAIRQETASSGKRGWKL